MGKCFLRATVLGLCLVAATLLPTLAGEKVVVGYLDNVLTDTFHSLLHKSAAAYAEKNNIEMRAMDSNWDFDLQIEQAKSAIADGANALIITPCDSSNVTALNEAGQAADVPVVYFTLFPFADKPVPDGVYFVGSRNWEAGVLQTEYMGEKLGGKGNVCILIGRPGTEAATSRTEAVNEVLKEKFPGITVLAQETAMWQRDAATEVTEKWLKEYGDSITAILANNDEMAIGAIKALKAAGRDDVMVAGVDGTPDGLEAIESGAMTVSVLQDAAKLGQTVTRLAASLAAGEKSEPITWVPFALITRENVEEFKAR